MIVKFEDLQEGQNKIKIEYGTNSNMTNQKIIKVNGLCLIGVTEILAEKGIDLLNVVWKFKKDKQIIASYFMSPKQHLNIHIDCLGGACYNFE